MCINSSNQNCSITMHRAPPPPRTPPHTRMRKHRYTETPTHTHSHLCLAQLAFQLLLHLALLLPRLCCTFRSLLWMARVWSCLKQSTTTKQSKKRNTWNTCQPITHANLKVKQESAAMFCPWLAVQHQECREIAFCLSCTQKDFIESKLLLRIQSCLLNPITELWSSKF